MRMARFPRNEVGLSQLARDVSAGLDGHPEVFPNPPMTAPNIEEAIATFDTSRLAALHAAAKARQATAAKKKARANLERGIRSTIEYAEAVSRGQESRLRLLG